MQRSSFSWISSHIVRPRFCGLIGGSWRDFTRNNSSDSWDQDDSGSSGFKTPRVTTPRASATSTVLNDAGSYSRGTNTGALERRINREDNMWRDRSYMDTKWLNPRDPSAYRPNFRPTEPTSLRKQFMRSPDEISREVMGRDWEETVKTYKRSITTMGGDQKLAPRSEAWPVSDTLRNRHKHLQRIQMQQQHERQQKQAQQQEQRQQRQSQRRGQQNYWGRNVTPPKDQ
ncbi:ras-interacting protein RIP3 [Drosophila eugracilis]|uniref:ras-interacting protein RIP3 n=1 Tax=Drosophila eugracilis TaxID=29029 RepID=UPI0007E757EE|nr:ras-interacting protein RIP3 [Drosophila eugracilis]XP_017066798.1 ras-interacting protein RIP3 [Drosophila eugracilis]